MIIKIKNANINHKSIPEYLNNALDTIIKKSETRPINKKLKILFLIPFKKSCIKKTGSPNTIFLKTLNDPDKKTAYINIDTELNKEKIKRFSKINNDVSISV